MPPRSSVVPFVLLQLSSRLPLKLLKRISLVASMYLFVFDPVEGARVGGVGEYKERGA